MSMYAKLFGTDRPEIGIQRKQASVGVLERTTTGTDVRPGMFEGIGGGLFCSIIIAPSCIVSVSATS